MYKDLGTGLCANENGNVLSYAHIQDYKSIESQDINQHCSNACTSQGSCVGFNGDKTFCTLYGVDHHNSICVEYECDTTEGAEGLATQSIGFDAHIFCYSKQFQFLQEYTSKRKIVFYTVSRTFCMQ